jgi:hypothetical protein
MSATNVHMANVNNIVKYVIAQHFVNMTEYEHDVKSAVGHRFANIIVVNMNVLIVKETQYVHIIV